MEKERRKGKRRERKINGEMGKEEEGKERKKRYEEGSERIWK